MLLAACWTSTAPVAQPEPYVIPPRVPDPVNPPVACATFSEADPACASTCPREAPDDWTGCSTLAASLQTQGFVCSNLHPRTCQAPLRLPIACPPGGCVAVNARVIKTVVIGSKVEITLAVGQNAGVTTAWKATVVALDPNGGQTPVPNGAVTLVRVDRGIAVGMIDLTVDEIRRAPYVRLEP